MEVVFHPFGVSRIVLAPASRRKGPWRNICGPIHGSADKPGKTGVMQVAWMAQDGMAT